MPTIVSQVNASNQDCLVYKDILGNWQIDLTHLENAIGFRSPASKGQGSGLYFPNIPIPPGSTIHAAYLILRSSALNTAPGAKSIIRVEENANPIPFSTLADYWARSTWIVIQFWDFEYKDWKKDELYVSPEIGQFVQKVIDLPGWAENNPIVFFWEDHNERSHPAGGHEREAYSYDKNPAEAPRLEITYTPPGPPPPPPPPPLPTPPPPPRKGWAGLDLQYEYLDDGFKLTYHTDVPCHLFCRMTTTPPRRHSLPSMRRGLRITGDVRFCFVVYEDNEQTEAGDTLTHTWYKSAWPVCETRWFYFIGRVYGDTSPSESPIFEFHFPAPPPEPPGPIERVFIAQPNNRTIFKLHIFWGSCRGAAAGTVSTAHGAPNYLIVAGAGRTVSYWCWRGYLSFDTSPMPLTAQIVSARLELFVTAWRRTSSAAFPLIIATPGIQQDPPIPTDYGDQLPFAQNLGQVDLNTLIIGQYNHINLYDIGLAHINLTGNTKYCIRQQMDVADISPPLGMNDVNFHSEQKGIGFQPRLRIFYNPA